MRDHIKLHRTFYAWRDIDEDIYLFERSSLAGRKPPQHFDYRDGKLRVFKSVTLEYAILLRKRQ